jgi:hypothetical protein
MLLGTIDENFRQWRISHFSAKGYGIHNGLFGVARDDFLTGKQGISRRKNDGLRHHHLPK